MNGKAKTALNVGGGVVALGVVVGLIWGVPAVIAANAPTPVATVAAVQAQDQRTLIAQPVHPTPEPVAVVEQAPVEEAPAAPSGPDLCPSGTTSQASDGTNDTACAPDVCLTLRGLPDPAYPECDYFYPPEYYR